MAIHSLSHFYPSYAVATEVLADLSALGVSDADISLIESEADPRLPAEVGAGGMQSSTRSAATLGCGIGLGLGVLVGVRAISTDLLEPVAALGWLAPTVLGGAIGAALGALVGMATRRGGRHSQAHAIADGLERGQVLVMLQVDSSMLAPAQAVLSGNHGAAKLPFAGLEEPAPYDPVHRVERIVDPDGGVQVRYVREVPLS